MAKEKRTAAPKVPLMTTTLWDFRSRMYPGSIQGDDGFVGATPSYVIWNLLQHYTEPGWLVVDPMAGSGTTLDVARDLGRRALAYDLAPHREDIFRVDARKLPLENEKADFVFVDPPYSNHIQYSGQPECIGELDARQGSAYYTAMELVIREIHRVLKPDRFMAVYVCDSAKKGKPIEPIGFELFKILGRYFTPTEIIAVVRHNRTLKRQRFHDAAAEGHFYLRGFNYLFLCAKERSARPRPGRPKASRTSRGAKGSRKATSKRGGGARAEGERGGTQRAGGSRKSGAKPGSSRKKRS